MKYFSMFTGIGGFELGIQRAYNNKQSAEIEQDRKGGNRNTDEQPVLLRTTEKPPLCNSNKQEIQTKQTNDRYLSSNFGEDVHTTPCCVGYSEIDKYAIATYEKHFGGHKNYGNAKTINPGTLPDFDLLVGGFPCQSFSIAGKRKGFADTRGTLFFDIARIAKVKRPKMLLLENVKGLLNHDKGSTFAKILETLWELGYDVEWCVLNSKNFGVPQNRERVFIIGHLGGFGGRKVFSLQEIIGQTNKIGKGKVVGTICSQYAKNPTDGSYINVVGILNSETWMKRHEQIRRVHGIDGISPTLPTGTGGGVMTKIMNNSRIRRLTPLECERLQGFPDNWTIGSDTQRYKQCGNAVTVNVIEYVMGLILNTGFLNKKGDKGE